MFKLNNKNIFTGYIKELLHSYNLPTIDIYSTNKLYDKCYYIKDDNIVYYDNNKLDVIRPYQENDKIITPFLMTKNLEIKNNIYDYETHYFLGNYLRWIKHYHNLDLMQLYNCFCNYIPTNLKLNFLYNKTVEKKFVSNDSSYTIYMFPVSLFEKYTIAIDCDQMVEIVCGYYDKFLIEKKDLTAIFDKTYKKYSGLKFKDPVIYDKLSSNNISAEEYKNRDKLKMFIKVPSQNTSSIVVLEGEFKDINNYTLHQPLNNNIEHTTKQEYNKIIVNLEKKSKMIWEPEVGHPLVKLKSPSQLLKMNDEEFYCFADRLVEYLLGNVIDKMDSITDNIKRIQKSLSDRLSPKINLYIGDDGLWDEKLRYMVYSYAIKGKTSFDSLGYVDKDVEITLGKDIDIYKGEDSL